ncbi:hypothetical protein AURDEDRAFT_171065 [Auricularia subglabra TFB-10046 SS5]|nr:hypothetical protein AURDEDRAFT_171065 [Auricularia subglabra TFB-10046 SS5]
MSSPDDLAESTPGPYDDEDAIRCDYEVDGLVPVLGVHRLSTQGRVRQHVQLDAGRAPELAEAMRDLMFDKLHPLRKQRAREDEKVKLTLAKERAAAEARLRHVESELKEERAAAQKTEKELADEVAYWKEKAMAAYRPTASSSKPRKKHA